MYRHIQALREKPLHVRKQIAGIASFVITFFIFIFWLSGTGFSQNQGTQTVAKTPSSPETKKENGPLTASIANALSGFSVFKTSFSNMFGSHTSYTAPQEEVIEVVPDAQK